MVCSDYSAVFSHYSMVCSRYSMVCSDYSMLCSHYPQLKGTTVASTPEQERLRQISALNSQVIMNHAFVNDVNLIQ